MGSRRDVDLPPITWRQSAVVALALAISFAAAVSAGHFASGLAQMLIAGFSLALLIVVALVSIPALLRRSILRRWLFWPVEFRFTAGGLPFLLALFVLVVAAVNSGNNLLYLLVAALLGALLTSGILSALNLSGMALHFRFPEHVFAGQETPVHLTLENEKKLLASYSLTVTANSQRWIKPEPRSPRRWWPGRWRRKSSASNHNEPIEAQPLMPEALEMRPAYFPYVPSRGRLSATSQITFPHRGRYEAAAFSLSTRFPFALIDKRRRFRTDEHESSIIVYPPVSANAVRVESLVAKIGEIEEDQRGHGHDLYRVRPHLIGDSARAVHWKATAKTGELRVREFSREEDRRLRILFRLDNGASPQQVEKAIELCASLVWSLADTEAWIKFVGCNTLDIDPTRGEERAQSAGATFALPPASERFETDFAPARELVFTILDYLAVVDPTAEPHSIPAGELFQVAVLSQRNQEHPLGVVDAIYASEL